MCLEKKVHTTFLSVARFSRCFPTSPVSELSLPYAIDLSWGTVWHPNPVCSWVNDLPIFKSENSVQPGEDWFDRTLSRPCTLFSQKFSSSRFILLKTGSFNSLRNFIHRHETSICAHIFGTNSGFLMATSPYKKVIRFFQVFNCLVKKYDREAMPRIPSLSFNFIVFT